MKPYKHRNFCDINPLFYTISKYKQIVGRKIKNVFGKEKFAKSKEDWKLPIVISEYISVLIKTGKGIDPVTQENKAVNIRIAAKKNFKHNYPSRRDILVLAHRGLYHQAEGLQGGAHSQKQPPHQGHRRRTMQPCQHHQQPDSAQSAHNHRVSQAHRRPRQRHPLPGTNGKRHLGKLQLYRL